MKRDNIFWGGVLILFGVLLFLQQQGIVQNIFRYFWPLLLILLGGWIILGVYWKPAPSAQDSFSIPVGEAKNIHYHFAHGAGQLYISGGAPAGQALVGSAAVGMNRTSRLLGDQLEVRVEVGPSFVPFLGPNEGAWRFQLVQDIPSTVVVESGASFLNIDLRDLLATRLVLKTGASSANVTMPARGASTLDVETGAASINIRIPEGTAARIRVQEGVTAMDVDTNRFPRLDSGIFESADFATAQNRTEIHIQSGLGSISVK